MGKLSVHQACLLATKEPPDCYSLMQNPFHSIRQQYTRGTLSEEQVDRDPVKQLELWIKEAMEAECPEPTAMILSTTGTDLRPSSRVVLMKGLDEHGITFFTNYDSRKGHQLASNPYASLLFFWPDLERQVRIEGTVERVSKMESDNYYDSRPEQSRISAAVSPQSQEISSRRWLEEEIKAQGSRLEAQVKAQGSRFKAQGKDEGVSIERPENWGGYRLILEYFEFWQGGADRLHDRIIYIRTGSEWRIARLAP